MCIRDSPSISNSATSCSRVVNLVQRLVKSNDLSPVSYTHLDVYKRQLRGSGLQHILPSDAQMRQRSRPAVRDDAAVVDDLLKLGGGSGTLSGCQVCFPTHKNWIEAGNIGDEPNLPQLDGRGSSLQVRQGENRILSVQRQLRLNRGQPKRLHLVPTSQDVEVEAALAFAMARATIQSDGNNARTRALFQWAEPR